MWSSLPRANLPTNTIQFPQYEYQKTTPAIGTEPILNCLSVLINPDKEPPLLPARAQQPQYQPH